MKLPSEYYDGKTIFVTGATGLVGKLLIEKLLRLNVGKIFVFVREKKNVSPSDRLEAFLTEEVFQNHSNDLDKIRKKIVTVVGDLLKPGLGLNENDINYLSEETEIVFHSAAHMPFEDNLAAPFQANTVGTKQLLEVAERMVNLQCFVYVSTAYSNCCRKIVKEEFYEPSIDPELLIKAMPLFRSEEEIAIMTNAIIKPWPKSYMFSKALAEELVHRANAKIPVVVVRPSVILTTYKEPIPGFTNNLHGLNGIIVGAGSGFLRIMRGDSNKLSDIIPADYVINFILLAGWKRITSPDSKLIYNCCSSNNTPYTNGNLCKKLMAIGLKYPPKDCLWKINFGFVKSAWLAQFLTILYHFIPAIFFDLKLKYSGQKLIIMKLYRKVAMFASTVGFFFDLPCFMDNTEMLKLIDELPESQRKQFECDPRTLKWDEFFYTYIIGLRVNLRNDPLDTLPVALKRQKQFTVLHYTLQALFICLIGAICWQLVSTFNII